MLPLGVANNIVPPRNNPPPAPVTFGDLSGGGGTASSNLPGRYQLQDGGATSGGSPNYLGANNPPRSLGAEGGLFQTIQQGSAGLSGIQLPPPPSSGGGNSGSLPNYPVSGSAASGNYPSSLSSSGSLANLGIVPSKFEGPASELGNPAVVAGIDGGSAGTVAPVLPKESRPTQQPHGIFLSQYHLVIFSLLSFPSQFCVLTCFFFVFLSVYCLPYKS